MEPSQHPLDSIIHERRPSPSSEKSAVSSNEVEELTEENQPPRSMPAPPALSPNSIKAPALLVDQQLHIVWQNSLAIEKIWHRAGAAINGSATPYLFDLLFDPHFQRQVDNWRRWTAFFIQQAQCMMPEEAFQEQLDQMTDRQKEVVSNMMGSADSSPTQYTFSSRIRQVLSDGRIKTYAIVATDFDKGRLLVFETCLSDDDPGNRHPSYEIEQRIEDLRRHPNPIKRPFSIMAANLNNAAKLNLEMLSDEYCLLINDVCQRSIEIIEQYGGAFNKHLDSGFFAYFLPLDDAEDNDLRAIECCLELKSQIAELSRQWKVRKSWARDIELNIGIHKAYEHVGTLSSYAGEMVASSGSALRIVTTLSRLTQSGQIWATKSLFKEMQANIYKQLRFGVMKPEGQRHPRFIHKCFLAITDIPGFKANTFATGEGLESIAVTQIFDRQA